MLSSSPRRVVRVRDRLGGSGGCCCGCGAVVVVCDESMFLEGGYGGRSLAVVVIDGNDAVR